MPREKLAQSFGMPWNPCLGCLWLVERTEKWERRGEIPAHEAVSMEWLINSHKPFQKWFYPRWILNLLLLHVSDQQSPMHQFPMPETISFFLKWGGICLGRDEASIMLFLWLRGVHSRWPQNTEGKQYLETGDVSECGHLGDDQHHGRLDRAQDLFISWKQDRS